MVDRLNKVTCIKLFCSIQGWVYCVIVIKLGRILCFIVYMYYIIVCGRTTGW